MINQVAFFYEEESLVVCSGPALKNLHFFCQNNAAIMQSVMLESLHYKVNCLP